MSPRPVRLRTEDPADDNRVVIEWVMSSVCNYACSYCPVYLHDNRVRWPQYAYALEFCRTVHGHYSDCAAVTFLLTGGEITLYPELPRLATELKDLPAAVAILSNGSRPLDWWRSTLGLFDEVLISYHHQLADKEHLLAVARLLATRSRVQFNVVIDPGNFDQTMAFAARAGSETAAIVNRKIMFRDGWKRQAGYSPEQRQRLDQVLVAKRDPCARETRRTVLKSDRLVLEYEDGAARTVTPHQIINEGLNHWAGWTCAVGQRTLFVRFDEVWRAACRAGDPIGSIYDEDLSLPSHPIRCTAESCNCIAGITAPKSANGD